MNLAGLSGERMGESWETACVGGEEGKREREKERERERERGGGGGRGCVSSGSTSVKKLYCLSVHPALTLPSPCRIVRYLSLMLSPVNESPKIAVQHFKRQ